MKSGKANALQAIGAYMCAYSDATYELGETLKVLFKLENNEMADAVVAALGDFDRQARLMRALCTGARNVDGTGLSEERKRQIDSVISDCYTCNDERVKIAHGRLEPHDDGSVEIVYMKVDRGGFKGRDPIIWSPTNWTNNTNKLTKLADELRNFQKELKNIEIQVPTAILGWLREWDDSAQIHRQRNAALLDSGPTFVPGPSPDEPA
jgi:hypothetical protein